MYLRKIKFHKNVVFDSNREDQTAKFNVKSKTVTYEDRRKPIYDGDRRFGGGRQIGYEMKTVVEKTFVIFKKNLEINFKNLTVIVGDNGCGKTSLAKNLKPPKGADSMLSSFLGEDPEELKKKAYAKWLSTEKRDLTFEATPESIIVGQEIHKNSFVDGLARGKMTLNGYEVNSLFDMQQSSNGENTLDYISELHRCIKNSLIVLDEPETSLSIKSQMKVARQIQELAMHNQVIVITHSPYIMRITDEVYDFEAKKYIPVKRYIKKQEKYGRAHILPQPAEGNPE